MARLDLPMIQQAKPQSHDGQLGSAHTRPRDAYREVPILQRPTWHHLIAAYFYCGGISSGASAFGSLAALSGGERLRTMARTAHYVSFAALLPCPVCLILDLGKPELFYHMLRIFKPSSPMNLGSWALTMHGGFSALAVAAGVAQEVKVPVLGPLLRLLPEQAVGAAGLPSGL
ncbi:MAG TPA: NrfD/PsrC family molybdoenzyme membrane anchor subunit, partial [Chloroflexota bacterium]|nr:NrfD/PsrC family molybdoenzyme membrane anchor subunit [Chloroflexota bacterium]